MGFNVADFMETTEFLAITWTKYFDGKIGIEKVIKAYEDHGFDANQDTPGNVYWEELYNASPKGTKVGCPRSGYFAIFPHAVTRLVFLEQFYIVIIDHICENQLPTFSNWELTPDWKKLLLDAIVYYPFFYFADTLSQGHTHREG